MAAEDLLSIKPEDVLALVEDIDDTMWNSTSTAESPASEMIPWWSNSLMGYDTASMDHLWMFVQGNYK
ncbi:hypothetical protein [Ensifer sp. ZNC0028]|uniref:hypothetical protein n=1 Tax=Ensifer sp. ZNC0028 TaxID=1339236 RepID=UPI0005BA25F4|nr:hypothetical protein [Ensifer sp. ZNC0028]